MKASTFLLILATIGVASATIITVTAIKEQALKDEPKNDGN